MGPVFHAIFVQEKILFVKILKIKFIYPIYSSASLSGGIASNNIREGLD